MAASNLPVQAPDRQPESRSNRRPAWPRPEKKATRFVIKIAGIIPT